MLQTGSRKREKAMGKHEPINIKKEIYNSGKFHPGRYHCNTQYATNQIVRAKIKPIQKNMGPIISSAIP